MPTVDLLAADLAVDPGDIRVLAAQLGHPGDDLPALIAADIRDQLSPHCERIAECGGLYWPGSDPDAGSGATLMR